MTQTTLRIDTELYKKLKIEAVLNDVSTNVLICDILRKHFEQKITV